MGDLNRRQFLGRSLACGAALTGFAGGVRELHAGLRTTTDGISLAEWALNQEIRAGEFKNLDFPRIAREEFGIGAVEFVNTLFEVPTYGYLKKLKNNAAQHGVKMPVLMVDDEGDPTDPSEPERRRFVTNHKKWVDIADYLGCHSVRTNCRGAEGVSKAEGLNYAAESYCRLLEYSVPARVSIVIENHGGLSDDAEWMIALLEKVDNLYFGSYIDWRWREPSVFDSVGYLEKMLPYAKGMSYKKQPSLEQFEKMITISREGGYRGYYAIEEKGRESILYARKVFERVLFGSS